MKISWKVLLSVGLMLAFSMPALAVDVKFSGSYYAQGWYIDNHELSGGEFEKFLGRDYYGHGIYGIQGDRDSRAFINQRLRIQTVFQVAEGLALTTRFDALEKKWGDQNWKGGMEDVRDRPVGGSDSSSSSKQQENIEFERAYVSFTTAAGMFDVGYQQGSSLFGTDFLDSDESVGRIKYTLPVGPVKLILSYDKVNEDMAGSNTRDADDEIYSVAGIYKSAPVEAGLIYKYIDGASAKPMGWRTSLHVANPYAKMAAGPLNVEAEAYYIGGKVAEFESPLASFPDIDAESYGGYVKAQMDIAPVYLGAVLAYMRGDEFEADGTTGDQVEGGFMPMLHWGENFKPTLILWNYDYTDWVGLLTGNPSELAVPITGYMDNVQFAQGYLGFKPIPRLDVRASLAYAKADKIPTYFVDKEYGYEGDVTASYKIYDNLEYMIGAAYLWAGDYFKADHEDYPLDDNYLLMHKLTLTF